MKNLTHLYYHVLTLVPQIGRFVQPEGVSWDNLWDIAPSKRGKYIPQSNSVRNIILVRHAHYYADNDEDDSVLSDLGFNVV